MDFTTFFHSDNKKLRHLVVRFSGDLPYRIEEVGSRTPSFLIPKWKRLDILEFMENHPKNILRRNPTKWVLFGIPPPLIHGSGNRHRTFLSCVKQALKSSQHKWSRLPLVELQKQQQIKELYEHYFKFSPNPITQQSVMAAIHNKLQIKPKASMPHR